jgi:hypothetical protein
MVRCFLSVLNKDNNRLRMIIDNVKHSVNIKEVTWHHIKLELLPEVRGRISQVSGLEMAYICN